MSEKSGFNWGLGCAIGCGGLILVGLLAAGGLWYLASKGMEAGKVVIAEELRNDFDERVADAEFPEDRLTLMTRLVNLATDEDTSFAMLLMCSAAYEVGIDAQSDMTDEERDAMIQGVIDFVSEDPGAGFIKMGTFIDQNPEYSDIFDNLQNTSFEFGNHTGDPVNDQELPPTAIEEPLADPVQ